MGRRLRILDEHICQCIRTLLAELREAIVLVLPAGLVPLHPSSIGPDLLAEPVPLVLQLCDAEGEYKLLENDLRVVAQLVPLFHHFTGRCRQRLELEKEDLNLD